MKLTLNVFAADQTHVESFCCRSNSRWMFLLQIKLTLNVFAADQTDAEDCIRKAGERDGAGEAGHEQRRP